MRTANFQPVQYSATRLTITGTLAVAALAGMVVNLKAGTTEELELSTGKAGFFLPRDVVADKAALKTLIESNQLRPDKDGFEYPYVAGEAVTGEDYELIEIEGAALDASMDGTIVAGQQVTTASGKISKLTNSQTQECLGVVRLVADDVNGSGKRFTIQVIRAPKNVPAP
jgi:hypothetical protein